MLRVILKDEKQDFVRCNILTFRIYKQEVIICGKDY